MWHPLKKVKISVFDFSIPNEALYRKIVEVVKVKDSLDTYTAKILKSLTWAVLEIFIEMYKKHQSTLTLSSGQTVKLSVARLTSRDSPVHWLSYDHNVSLVNILNNRVIGDWVKSCTKCLYLN